MQKIRYLCGYPFSEAGKGLPGSRSEIRLGIHSSHPVIPKDCVMLSVESLVQVPSLNKNALLSTGSSVSVNRSFG